MLKNLRQYIIRERMITGEGKTLKTICERSHRRAECVDFLEEIRENIQYLTDMDIHLFRDLACNYHLMDAYGGDLDVILQLMVSCFGESARVETDRGPIINQLSYLYENEEYPEYRWILDFLESHINDEENIVLDCLTDPSLTESQVDNIIEEANYNNGEEELLYCIFTISEDEEKYDEFQIFMEMMGTEKISETSWITCVEGYDDYYSFTEVADVDMNEFIELISGFEMKGSFDSFDNIFGSICYETNRIHARIIDSVMDARRTEREVLM